MRFKAALPVSLALSPLAAAAVKTALSPKKISSYSPKYEPEREREYAEKLSKMVRYETVSKPRTDLREKFLGFHKVLEELFPTVHEKLEKTEIDGNLLYYWKGRSSERPMLLMSHQDVVPAGDGWSHEPFSGDIADGKVWGRGSADTKCTVMAFLQAAEELLNEGFEPEQDIYLASSCTEEWGGDGAPKLIAELLRRNVRPYMLCDEGGAILSEPIGGIKGYYAMIGILEKGKADIKFTARSKGGHASAPGRNTPVAKLAAFVNEFEKHDPFRRKFIPEVSSMFGTLSEYAPFGLRFVMGNLWLFAPIMKLVMPYISSQANAMLKTTVAFTMLSGSNAYNVIPEAATLGANVRYIPHQDEAESLEIIKKLAAKYGLETEIIHSSSCAPAVDIDGEAYKRVTGVIEQTFPGLAHSPYVMTGATDSRFYTYICDNCIRFGPVVFGQEQLKGMHGIDECIDTNCLPGAVDFYKNLIKAAD